MILKIRKIYKNYRDNLKRLEYYLWLHTLLSEIQLSPELFLIKKKCLE